MSAKKNSHIRIDHPGGFPWPSRLAARLDGTGTCYASRRLGPEDATPFDSLSDLVAATFHAFDAHVFVAAAGIVVRCIAPQLQSKETDPAVVCLDQQGEFAVSLLSGHLGGANELAAKCARALGGAARDHHGHRLGGRSFR